MRRHTQNDIALHPGLRHVVIDDTMRYAGELAPAIEALERSMIRQALAACGGNRRSRAGSGFTGSCFTKR